MTLPENILKTQQDEEGNTDITGLLPGHKPEDTTGDAEDGQSELGPIMEPITEEPASDPVVTEPETTPITTPGEETTDPITESETQTEPVIEVPVKPDSSVAAKESIPVWTYGVMIALSLLVVTLLIAVFSIRKKYKKAVRGIQEPCQPMQPQQTLKPEMTAPIMQNQIDNSLGQPGENAMKNKKKALGIVKVGKLQNIGQRKSQQDSFCISDIQKEALVSQKGILALVADGMGGLESGDEVSSLVTVTMLQYFCEVPFSETEDRELLKMLQLVNQKVNAFLGPDRIGKCGSTLVSVIIKQGIMNWISVGDSHIYLYREGALIQLNREHVYGVDLDQKAVCGEISFEEADTDSQRKALTSFIGAGKLNKVDQNNEPLQLCVGDRILLMSDGVFGTISNEEIEKTMKYPVDQSAAMMEDLVKSKGKGNQDNFTAVVLEYM